MQNAADWIAEASRARAKGDREAARTCYSQAALRYGEEGLALARAHAIRHVADLWLEDAQYARARPLYEDALAAYRGNLQTGILDLANTVRPYALLNEATGDPEAARALWLEAKVLYTALRVEEGVAECDRHLQSLQQENARN